MPNQRKQPTREDPNPSAADPTSPDNLDFEDAIEKVESIIEDIESGAVGLEASLDAYEQGVNLIKRCRTLLRNAEQRVQDLFTALEQQDNQPQPQPPTQQTRTSTTQQTNPSNQQEDAPF